jgi:hypothetical protein
MTKLNAANEIVLKNTLEYGNNRVVKIELWSTIGGNFWLRLIRGEKNNDGNPKGFAMSMGIFHDRDNAVSAFKDLIIAEAHHQTGNRPEVVTA